MTLTEALIVGALLAAPASARAAADPGADAAVLKLHIVTNAGAVDATGVLIHREDRGRDVVLYVLTSSHLFRGPGNEPWPRTPSVRIFLDDEQAVDVRPEDVFVTGGALIDVAVLRATAAGTALVARPPTYEAPPVGELFLVSGYDRHGAAATVAERVRFRSTRLAVGDRDASALVGCVGAPAISEKGVFGVVSECDAGRAPVIALLSLAQLFIERHVPRAAIRTSSTRIRE